jgi:hypothetical protein
MGQGPGMGGLPWQGGPRQGEVAIGLDERTVDSSVCLSVLGVH